jgi:predicted nuclease of predicted toxin-antitoxin system
LITFDKDFGELAFRRGLFSPAGIVLFRIKAPSSAQVAQVAVAVLEGRSDWAGQFSVIEEGRVRMTPLPGSQ